MSRSKYKVIGTFDIAGGIQRATVTIDRTAGIISVRPYRRKREYTLPLASVASMICNIIIRAELREKKAKKRKGRR